MKTGLYSACGLVVFAFGASAFAQLPAMPRMPTAQESAALAAQGVRPGDDTLTCEQIGAEMAPYAQALMPSAMALGQTSQELQAMGERNRAQAAGQMGMGMAAGIASSMLPGGGMIAQAQAAAQVAQAKKQMAEAEPLREKQMSQSADLAAQLAPMQQEPRFQRLMQLAEAKCKEMQR
jgi:hypothetical protein